MPSINYSVEYGGSKGFVRPKIKKGKDFNHYPKILISGTIEGKKDMPPTLKSLFGGDINGDINLNNYSLKMPQFKIEDDISGYIDGTGKIDIPNININGPTLRSGKIKGSMNFNNGELIESQIPGININEPSIDGNINIKGPKFNLQNSINNYHPNTLKGIFNGDIDDPVHLKRLDLKLPQYRIDDISGYIPGNKLNGNIDLNMPNIDISGPKLRGKKIKLEGPGLGGSVNINGPNFDGELIEGNIPGIGKSVMIPNIRIEDEIIPNSLKGAFSGDINDDIKLNQNYSQ